MHRKSFFAVIVCTLSLIVGGGILEAKPIRKIATEPVDLGTTALEDALRGAQPQPLTTDAETEPAPASSPQPVVRPLSTPARAVEHPGMSHISKSLLGLSCFQKSQKISQSGLKRSEIYNPLKGIWLPSMGNAIDSPENVESTLGDIYQRLKMDTVYLSVWNKGCVLFENQRKNYKGYTTVRDLVGLSPYCSQNQYGRDILRETLERGKKFGVKVVPWFEYGFRLNASWNDEQGIEHTASAIYKKPELFTWGVFKKSDPKIQPGARFLPGHEWSIPTAFVMEKVNLSYMGKFAYLNPFNPEARQILIDLILESTLYPGVDTVQIDDQFSLPVNFGYDPYTVNKYKNDPARAHSKFRDRYPPMPSDPTVEPGCILWREWNSNSSRREDMIPPVISTSNCISQREKMEEYYEWLNWRQDHITALIKDLSVELHKRNVKLNISPNHLSMSRKFYLQDWKTWIDFGYADELTFQNYKNNETDFINGLNRIEISEAHKCVPVSVGIYTRLPDDAMARQRINPHLAKCILERPGFASRFDGKVYFEYQTFDPEILKSCR